MAEMIIMVKEVLSQNLWAALLLGAVLGIAVYTFLEKAIRLNRESALQDELPDEWWADRWERM